MLQVHLKLVHCLGTLACSECRSSAVLGPLALETYAHDVMKDHNPWRTELPPTKHCTHTTRNTALHPYYRTPSKALHPKQSTVYPYCSTATATLTHQLLYGAQVLQDHMEQRPGRGFRSHAGLCELLEVPCCAVNWRAVLEYQQPRIVGLPHHAGALCSSVWWGRGGGEVGRGAFASYKFHVLKGDGGWMLDVRASTYCIATPCV